MKTNRQTRNKTRQPVVQLLLRLLPLLLLPALSAACGGTSPTANVATAAASPTPAAPSAATSTPVPPTNTPTPVPPTSTPTPTPVVRPGAALGPENVAGLAQLAQIGRGEVNTLHWAPDGSALALATGLGVYLFDGATLEQRALLPTGYTHHVRFSPDGASLGLAGEHWYGLWDLGAGAYRFEQETPYTVEALAFDAESGALLVAAAEDVPVRTAYGTMSRYDLHVQHYAVTDGARLRAFKLVDPDGRTLIPRFVDGGRVVETLSPPFNYYWWDAQTGRQLYTYQPGSSSLAALRSAGGRAFGVAYTNPAAVSVVDLATGGAVDTLTPGGTIYGLFADEAGSSVFVLAEHLTQWNAATLEKLADFALTGVQGQALIPSPDLSRAVVREDGSLRLLDLAAGTLLAEQPGFYDRAWQVALSADGRLLAASRGTYYGQDTRVETWDTARLERLAVIDPGRENSLVGLALGADGRVLTGIAEQPQVRFWDPSTGAPSGTLALDRGLTGFALARDGSRLAVSHTADGSLWDLDGGTRLVGLGDYGSYVSRVAISGDGARAALTYFSEYGVVLWDVAQEQALVAAPDCSKALVSPDGAQFACSQPQALLIWDAASGAELYTLPLPAEIVHLAYTPDSRLLVASCEDGALYFWDAQSAELLYRLEYPARHFAFSADGRLIATAASEGSVRLWGLAEP